MLVSLTNEGELRWEKDITEIGPLSSSLICDQEGTIFGSAWFSSIYAITSDGELKWITEIGQINGNSPALAAERLFFGTWYKGSSKKFYKIK